MLKKIKKLLLGAIAVAIVGIVLSNSSAFVSAYEQTVWGPVDRTPYTLEEPADEPVFNSITNNHNTEYSSTYGEGVTGLGQTVDHTNPASTPDSGDEQIGLGDERNFVRIRKAGTNDIYTDVLEAVPGEQYEVYVYFHNNAKPTLGAAGTAVNTRLKIEAPEEVLAGQAAKITGIITWNKGADPTEYKVWDSTFLKAKETVYLRYVPNTAVLHNGLKVEDYPYTANGEILPDDALYGENGAKLADVTRSAAGEDRWGTILACNEYAGYVTFTMVAEQPKYELNKEVSADGVSNWTDTIEAAPGDTLHFRIHFKNVGTVNYMKVNATDFLPKEMKYEVTTNKTDPEKNFVTYITSGEIGKTPVRKNEALYLNPKDFFGENGSVIGDYEPQTEFYVNYDVKLADEEAFTECSTILWNKAQIAVGTNDSQHDSVKVTVIKKNCTIPETGSNNDVIMISIIAGAAAYCFVVGVSKAIRKR